MVLVGNTQDFIMSQEAVYGDGGDYTTSKFRLGTSMKLTSPNFSNNWRDIEGGDIQIIKKVVGEKDFKFDLEFFLTDLRFSKYVMNVVSETGTDPNFTHTLDLSQTSISELTFATQWKLTNALAYNLVGCRIIDVSFNWSKPSGEGDEAFIKMKLSLTCKDITKEASTFETLVEDKTPFMFNNVKLTTGSSEIVEVNSGSYNLNPNADTDTFYCNNSLVQTREKPIYTIFTHALNLNINVKDETKFDEFLARLEVTGTNTLEFIRNANESITIDFNKFYNLDFTQPTEFRQVVKSDLVFNGRLNNIVAKDAIENY